MTSKLTPVIEAWAQTAHSIIDLVVELSEPEWNLPTECPGWSVRDCVSHVIGIERELMGEPTPWHQLPRDLVHVQTDVDRYTEIPVDIRRCHTPAEMVAELREVVDRRLTMLRGDTRGPDDEVVGMMGVRRPYLPVLTLRVFDVWAHEQDIRRAVGRPGNLDGPAAELSRERILAGMPRVVARDAGAPPGSTVLFDVSGPVAFTRTVSVGTDRRGSLTGEVPASPTVWLRMDWETFVRLGCGRVQPETADVKIEGDEDLAGQVLAKMAVTP